MTGKSSRDKGKRGELEICRMIRDELGVVVNRNLKQYQQAQHGDIEQLIGGYCFEIKNCASTSNIKAWYAQAWAAAEKRGALPCLAYKVPRKGWRFVVPLEEATGRQWGKELCYAQTLDPQGFFLKVRERGIEHGLDSNV